jgi:hypothetical protein
MTRFNGSKRVKVDEAGTNASSGVHDTNSTAAASFTGSIFGSMGRKLDSPQAQTPAQLASEEKRKTKEEKRVAKEKEQEKKNRERKRMEGKLLKGDTDVARLAKQYREQKIPKNW